MPHRPKRKLGRDANSSTRIACGNRRGAGKRFAGHAILILRNKRDKSWMNLQLANSSSPLSVTGSAVAPLRSHHALCWQFTIPEFLSLHRLSQRQEIWTTHCVLHTSTSPKLGNTCHTLNRISPPPPRCGRLPTRDGEPLWPALFKMAPTSDDFANPDGASRARSGRSRPERPANLGQTLINAVVAPKMCPNPDEVRHGLGQQLRRFRPDLGPSSARIDPNRTKAGTVSTESGRYRPESRWK